MKKYALIAVGGACGSMARYWVSVTAASHFGVTFPYGTLTVNLAACLAIGFLIASAASGAKKTHKVSPWRFLIAVGFIGAFSTFSTFEWELFARMQSSAFLAGATYACVSLALGLIAVWAGTKISRAIMLPTRA